jgi:cell division protein FtsI (penicillin-binding protein 3)
VSGPNSGVRHVRIATQPAVHLQALERRGKAKPGHHWRVGSLRRRLLFVLTGIVASFVVLLVWVGLIQTKDAKSYESFMSAQRTRSEVLPAPRGEILDRSGKPLALSVVARTIYADPRSVADPVRTVHALSLVLGLSDAKQASLLAAFKAKTSSFVYVAREVDPSTAQVVDNLKLAGIGSQEESKRYLPNGEVGKGVIGATNVDGDGIAGLEKQYERFLTGTPGQLRQALGTKGRSIPKSQKALVDAIPGKDVQLTLDLPLQYEAEQAVLDKVNELGARGGSAVVMDSSTGEVLAMASVRRDPTTDVVSVGSANYAAVDSYEPGSVAKVITVSAGLNEKVVTPQTTFLVPAAQLFFDKVLHDAEPHPTANYTVNDILARSSNIGTIFISQLIGPDKQESYMRAFGFGEQTALDFPGESKGILRPDKQWRGTENVTVSYGQGVSATAIQLVSAVNVIANGGVYVAPKIVKSVIDPNGSRTDTMPSATRRVIAPDVAEEMNLMMRDVVCDGTAKGWADVKGYTVAGKTGTGFKAQKNGTYLDDSGHHQYYASFVGFLPAENPRITVLVSIDEPPAGAQHFGANTAAPVFRRIAAAAILALGIQPPTTSGGCPTTQRTAG